MAKHSRRTRCRGGKTHRKQNKKNKISVIAKKGLVGEKKYQRDHDQIHEDLKAPEKFKIMPKDEYLPAEGQFYCVACSRYMVSMQALEAHRTSKVHKRRLKQNMDEPHTQEDAEAAVGMSH